MGRRLLAWVLVTPVATAGLLLSHAVAYRVTGTPSGQVHDYLAHAPQVLGVLATLGLVGLALQERSAGLPSAGLVALLAPFGFACQEHLERLTHTGELPWLVTTPAFLLGLVLQIPVALACVLIARRVRGTLAGLRRRGVGLPGGAWLPMTSRPVELPGVVRLARPTGRAPPRPLSS